MIGLIVNILFYLLSLSDNPAPDLTNDHTAKCNKLGAWVWYPEYTIFHNHYNIAYNLSNLGVKRVFVKISDGKVDLNKWPEMTDKSIPDTYHSQGLEVWGWSYNYPKNEYQQAQALHYAIEAGYDGYIVDVESQFDKKSGALFKLFHAFRSILDQAKAQGKVDDNFKLYCTTWGNPKDHHFAIHEIDPFVDGYMAQTYVEVWGDDYMHNIEYYIAKGNAEYASLGATKPVHHICATEKNIINVDHLNRFIASAGNESSLWVVPGSNTKPDIWNAWQAVNWHFDFCNYVSDFDTAPTIDHKLNTIVYETPLFFSHPVDIEVFDARGQRVSCSSTSELNLSEMINGLYFIYVMDKMEDKWIKVLKL